MSRPSFLFSAPCLLARWLRLFGFVARIDPSRVQVASPDPEALHFKVWIGSESEEKASSSREILLPSGDWREAFEVLAQALALKMDDLILNRCCPRCSSFLQAVASPQRPQGAPRGLPGVFVCEDCDRRGWAHKAHESHRRVWQELFLGNLFECGRCKKPAPRARGRNRLEVRSYHEIGPVEIPDQDLEVDPSQEIAAILKLLESRSAESIEADVHLSFELFLCTPCRRDFVRCVDDFRKFKPPSKNESESP